LVGAPAAPVAAGYRVITHITQLSVKYLGALEIVTPSAVRFVSVFIVAVVLPRMLENLEHLYSH
jgi:hypothetical protein